MTHDPDRHDPLNSGQPDQPDQPGQPNSPDRYDPAPAAPTPGVLPGVLPGTSTRRLPAPVQYMTAELCIGVDALRARAHPRHGSG